MNFRLFKTNGKRFNSIPHLLLPNLAGWLSCILIFLALLPLITSCARDQSINRQSVIITNSLPDTQDRSCAYFYYLSGNHAEYNQQLSEALEAYEKAFICDPAGDLILEKLVIIHIKMDNEVKAAQYLQILINKYPENINRQLLLARLYVHLDKPDKAIHLYLNILKDDPGNESGLLQLGLVYTSQKKYQLAKAAFLSVISINKDSYPANLYLARLAAEMNQVKSALEWYNKSLVLNWSPELINEVVQFCSIHQLYDELLRIYELVLLRHPTNETAGFGIIHILLLQGKEDEALLRASKLQLGIKIVPKLNLLLGRYFFAKKEYTKSESMLVRMLEKEYSSAPNYLLALVYIKQNKNQKALDLLTKLKPEDDEYQDGTHLQVKLLQDMKKNDEAIRFLQRKTADKKHVVPLDFLLLASLYQDLKDNDSAIDILNRSLKTFPNNEQILFELGLMYEKTGKQDLAIKIMQQLLLINQNHAEALNYLGYTWADNNEHLQQALKYIQQAITLKPNNGYIHDSLGWAYFRMGHLEKARTTLEHAISLAPDDPFIHDHLGDVYLQLSLPEKAVESYQKSFFLFSEKEEKELIKKKIDTINESVDL